ncbi:MAG: hypothetical protein OXC62_10440 [Aestuariivita sp.]|nr:hypothetical protein [Aestuariivita sp.]
MTTFRSYGDVWYLLRREQRRHQRGASGEWRRSHMIRDGSGRVGQRGTSGLWVCTDQPAPCALQAGQAGVGTEPDHGRWRDRTTNTYRQGSTYVGRVPGIRP